jgi:signal transduction histidine kinase
MGKKPDRPQATTRVAARGIPAPADEQADAEWLADLGEVVGPVTHEFNNFLNSLLLQLAVMESSVPEATKAELQAVKRQAKQVAGVIKLLQQYRRRHASKTLPVDLNEAVHAAAEALARSPAADDGAGRIRPAESAGPDDLPLRTQLATSLPPVRGLAADLRRLCRFLLNTAASTVGGGGSLTLSTAPADGGAVLRVEAAGATGGSLARLLDGPLAVDGGQGLELAACQSLVRRLGGQMRAEPTPGGEAIVVELPTA